MNKRLKLYSISFKKKMETVLTTFFFPYFVLSDKHSKRVRDLHLLKNLSAVLDKAKLGQGKKTEH